MDQPVRYELVKTFFLINALAINMEWNKKIQADKLIDSVENIGFDNIENIHKEEDWDDFVNNMFGQKVWYYKAVEVESSLISGFANEYEDYVFKPMVSKTLYATDIVLLGSMNDCDLNGVPKFFNYLKGSTYNMPTDILFTDTEIEYKFNEKNELMEQTSHKLSVSSCPPCSGGP